MGNEVKTPKSSPRDVRFELKHLSFDMISRDQCVGGITWQCSDVDHPNHCEVGSFEQLFEAVHAWIVGRKATFFGRES